MPDNEPMYISIEEALEAVRAAAWTEPAPPEDATCGHPGCEDHPGEGRKMIHVLSGFGMDLPLESAEEFVRNAQRCAWVQSLMGHELGAVCADGKARYFDVRRPTEVVSAHPLVSAEVAGSPLDREPSHRREAS